MSATNTTTQLITKAFYLSGVYSRDLQPVLSASDISNGLDLANACLAIKTANNRLVPYYTEDEITAIVSPPTETYFVPNLISVDTATYSINNVRYPMRCITRKPYFGAARLNGLPALPSSYHVERCFGGANISFYPLPGQAMTFVIYGKFTLETLTLGQNLALTLDAFYLEYLRYAIGEYIASDYGLTFPPQSQKKLDAYEDQITDIAPLDLSMIKYSTLKQNTYLSYGAMSLYTGFMPN